MKRPKPRACRWPTSPSPAKRTAFGKRPTSSAHLRASSTFIRKSSALMRTSRLTATLLTASKTSPLHNAHPQPANQSKGQDQQQRNQQDEDRMLPEISALTIGAIRQRHA